MKPTDNHPEMLGIQKLLPEADERWSGEGKKLYNELDRELVSKDKAEIKNILKQGMNVKLCPLRATLAFLQMESVIYSCLRAIDDLAFALFIWEDLFQIPNLPLHCRVTLVSDWFCKFLLRKLILTSQEEKTVNELIEKKRSQTDSEKHNSNDIFETVIIHDKQSKIFRKAFFLI